MSNRFNQSKRPQNPNIAPFARKRHAIITVVVSAQNWLAMVVLKCRVFVQHVILLDLCYSSETADDPRMKGLLQFIRSPRYRTLFGELPGINTRHAGDTKRIC